MSENNELEKTLWAAADKLRSNMDASEYKHIVLGLIFLKYISDAFNDLYEQLKAGEGEFEGVDPEDADEYLAHTIASSCRKRPAGSFCRIVPNSR